MGETSGQLYAEVCDYLFGDGVRSVRRLTSFLGRPELGYERYGRPLPGAVMRRPVWVELNGSIHEEPAKETR